MKNSVIILAAGDGSRLKSSVPKIFHKVGELSLIGHVLRLAHNISDDIAVVIKQSYVNYNFEFGHNIKKAIQPVPLGTGDAVKFGFSIINQDSDWCFILYGDIPLISLEAMQSMVKLQNTGVSVLILAMRSENPSLGKLEPTEQTGCIKSIVEARDANGRLNLIPLCNCGLMVKTDVLKKFLAHMAPSPITKEYYITDIVKFAYDSGLVCKYFEAPKEELSGANTRSELVQLENFFQKRMRQHFLDAGVSMISPETVFFSYDTEIESDVTIYPYVYFKPGVYIKSGADIGPFCVIEGAHIAPSSIGPFARLRPNTTILSGAKIGNFVEIKNSEIGTDTKVNHLSYIGDSTLGKQTNIGAGTITCNYDGFKKYRTTIGQNVFIGSNSAIVAPVQINANTMVGAGSVITKDVNSGELAIGRAKQINIKGFVDNFRKIKGK